MTTMTTTKPDTALDDARCLFTTIMLYTTPPREYVQRWDKLPAEVRERDLEDWVRRRKQ